MTRRFAARLAARALGVIAAALGVGCASLGGAIASARAHLEAPLVREAVAAEASRLASGAVPGALRFHGLHAPDDAGDWRVDGVEAATPAGDVTLALDGVEVAPDWPAIAWNRGLVVRSATVDRGRLHLGVPTRARSSVERALDGDGGGGGDERGPGRPLILVEGLRFADLVVDVNTEGGPDLAFTGLSGAGVLRLDRRDDVVLRAWGVAGRASTGAGPGASVGLEDASVWVDGGVPNVVDAEATVRFAGDRFPVVYRHDAALARGRLCAWPPRPGGASLALRALDVGLSLAQPAALELRVREGDASEASLAACGVPS